MFPRLLAAGAKAIVIGVFLFVLFLNYLKWKENIEINFLEGDKKVILFLFPEFSLVLIKNVTVNSSFNTGSG